MISPTDNTIHPSDNDEVKQEEEEEVEEAPPRSNTPPAGDKRARAPTPDDSLPQPDPPNLPEQTINPDPLKELPIVGQRTRLTSVGSVASVRSLPKDKKERAPLSIEARQARRRKEKNKRKEKRAGMVDGRRKAAITDPAPNTTTPKPTTPDKEGGKPGDGLQPHEVGSETITGQAPRETNLRTPAQVFGGVDPRFTVTVTREGAGESARGEIVSLLLFADEPYTIGPFRTHPDGVSFDVGADDSLRVVRETLEPEGWTVTTEPIWARYSLIVPQDYHNMPLDRFVRGLIRRNGRATHGPEGIPDNSIRAVGVAEEGGEGGNLPRRVRAWVDVSPEGEEYLAAHDHLLRTVTSGVRLRPATNSRPAPDRS